MLARRPRTRPCSLRQLVSFFLPGRMSAAVRRKRVMVLCLGDVGRSPRMQFHALSLANIAKLDVDLVGYPGVIRLHLASVLCVILVSLHGRVPGLPAGAGERAHSPAIHQAFRVEPPLAAAISCPADQGSVANAPASVGPAQRAAPALHSRAGVR